MQAAESCGLGGGWQQQQRRRWREWLRVAEFYVFGSKLVVVVVVVVVVASSRILLEVNWVLLLT